MFNHSLLQRELSSTVAYIWRRHGPIIHLHRYLLALCQYVHAIVDENTTSALSFQRNRKTDSEMILETLYMVYGHDYQGLHCSTPRRVNIWIFL